MSRDIMIILIDKRKEEATEVQKLLTEFGCSIRTRLGLHDGTLDACTNSGLIILDLVGEVKDHESLNSGLNGLDGVKSKIVNMSFDQ